MELFDKDKVSAGDIVSYRVDTKDTDEILNYIRNLCFEAIRVKYFRKIEYKYVAQQLFKKIIKHLEIVGKAINMENVPKRNGYLMESISSDDYNDVSMSCIPISSPVITCACLENNEKVLKNVSKNCKFDWQMMMHKRKGMDVFTDAIFDIRLRSDALDKSLSGIFNHLIEVLISVFSSIDSIGNISDFEYDSIVKNLHKCDLEIGNYLIGCITRKLDYMRSLGSFGSSSDSEE